MSTPKRRLFDIPLTPAQGGRFQPTGFPDLGAAEYDRPERLPDGGLVTRKAMLVESPQSVANHLEAVGWERSAERPTLALAGLPYVRVVSADDGRYLTSSRTEAHRLASAFIKDSLLDGQPMREVLRERLALRDDTPLAPRDIASAVFALDPLCLIHGVFFADNQWPGQPKIARSLTGFIEAYDVMPAHSGGVKRDEVRHAIGEDDAGAKQGYGSIPFHRTEYSAAEIVGYFSIDLAQIRSYGLRESATHLLVTLAEWEIRTLLDGGLRLRTACDLETRGPVVDRDGGELEDAETLAERLRQHVSDCRDDLGTGEPLEVHWTSAKKTGRTAVG